MVPVETCQMQSWAYCFSLTESSGNDFRNVLAISIPSVNSVSEFNHNDLRNVWGLSVFFLIILIFVLTKLNNSHCIQSCDAQFQ